MIDKIDDNTREMLHLIYHMADLLDEVSPVHKNGVDFNALAEDAIARANKVLIKHGLAPFDPFLNDVDKQ
jgi:hypothetical protein